MKIPVIKSVVERYNLDQLRAAEAALMNEEQLPIEIEGDDEGEQLTHILAAIFIKEVMERDGVAYPVALRQYTSRVRESIN